MALADMAWGDIVWTGLDLVTTSWPVLASPDLAWAGPSLPALG